MLSPRFSLTAVTFLLELAPHRHTASPDLQHDLHDDPPRPVPAQVALAIRQASSDTLTGASSGSGQLAAAAAAAVTKAAEGGGGPATPRSARQNTILGRTPPAPRHTSGPLGELASLG